MAYEFDPSHVQVIASLLDRNVRPEDDLMSVWERLWGDEAYKDLDEGLRIETDFLFTCELEENFESAGEVRLVESGLPITATRPMLASPASAWTLWSEVGAILLNPLLAAHIADMLFTARVQTTPVHAASTIELYLQFAELGEDLGHLAALSLARANYIARSRGMAEEGLVRAAMHRRLDTLSNTSTTIGPALTLLAALSAPPRSGEFEPAERESMRNQIIALGDSSAAFVDEVARTMFRLSEGPTELAASRRWHVMQYLMFAESDDHGMRKMHHAQTAEKLATSYGLPDLKDAAVLIMQSVTQDSMGWKTAAVEIPVPKNAFRAHLRKYRRARSWNHALMVFFAGKSPSGDHAVNIKAAERAATGSIRALVSQTVYGAHGLPERTDVDFMVEEVARTETIALDVSAILLALELDYVRDRFFPPPAPQIAAWIMDCFLADETLAEHFSESVTLHWAGRFSDSARLSIPLIERAARDLLLKLDAPLYRPQRGESQGRFPAMDYYVETLANQDLDPDWVRALRLTLLSTGMNLRNLSAHGFVLTFSENQSALLLRLAGLFCTMPIGVDKSDLHAPTTWSRLRLRRRFGWVWS
ncbi:hypothetical protein [Cryobacterium aureum]|uniref:hypothetical protein n=1 Tax=Cryobacterium aureum TaxID=995037 RepID=UPI000CF43141|nr:hypothetical protein [Cryobacterium aureum]